MATAIVGTVTSRKPNKAAVLKDLETQVRKARQFVRQSEIKVRAIETSTYEIEKFYPKIRIIRRPAVPRPREEDVFRVFAELRPQNSYEF